ncbi:MAG: B-4DMT family transporter [Gordonia sp. (in: high G+C Gram-positive bacteria)]
MSAWLPRAVVMTVVQIAARLLLALAVTAWPLQSPTFRWLAIAVVVLIAIIWGGIDGIRDAKAHPDPDDYADLTMAWLKTGAFAGFFACLICWIVGTAGMNGVGQASFPIEIIAGTSFITLLVYVPGFFGVSLGRFIVRREQRKAAGDADEDWSVHAQPTQPGLAKA